MPPDHEQQKNQPVFRAANERIRELAEDFRFLATTPSDYVCECANPSCWEPVSLTPSEYDTARADPDGYVVLPQHVADDERVVLRTTLFWVVAKGA